MILKYRCTKAVRFALLFAPRADSIAVTQVPIFWPIIMGITEPYVNAPVTDKACRIPTDAEEDWIIAVNRAPTITPKIGLRNMVRILVNSGTSARGFTAPLMDSIPNISTAKPKNISPISFFLLFFPVIYKIIPIRARTGEKEEGLKSFTIKLSPWIPVRLKTHEVTVVPTLAPIIIPMAWYSFIIPELTKPTTMTVVAEEDWITAVTPAPKRTALTGLEVRRSKIISNLPPDSFSKPAPITLIPYKNSASPPIKVSMPKISIFISLYLLILSTLYFCLLKLATISIITETILTIQ